MNKSVTHRQATQLLHNKCVVVLGDSVQRSIYKDLVLLLQRDEYLSPSQLRTKGELCFENDCLVKGGRMGPMNNGTEYREVRQYCTDHHLIRFYFLTRVFSGYLKSILKDIKQGPQPDVIVVNSCVWDISRYGSGSFEQYIENLHVFFREIKEVVPPKCLILWTMAMPLGRKIKGGFLVPEVSHMATSLRHDVIEANFYSAKTAEAYDADILDLHYHFRLTLQHRMADGIHWDALAHRRISGLLLHHIAVAWGVDLHDPTSTQGEGNQPLRPWNLNNRVDQPCQDYRPRMDFRSTTDENFHYGADDRCMRRRRRVWRPNNYHPYLHHPHPPYHPHHPHHPYHPHPSYHPHHPNHPYHPPPRRSAYGWGAADRETW